MTSAKLFPFGETPTTKTLSDIGYFQFFPWKIFEIARGKFVILLLITIYKTHENEVVCLSVVRCV